MKDLPIRPTRNWLEFMHAARARVIVTQLVDFIRLNGGNPAQWFVTLARQEDEVPAGDLLPEVQRTVGEVCAVSHGSTTVLRGGLGQSMRRRAYSARDAHAAGVALIELGCVGDADALDECATYVLIWRSAAQRAARHLEKSPPRQRAVRPPST